MKQASDKETSSKERKNYRKKAKKAVTKQARKPINKQTSNKQIDKKPKKHTTKVNN